MQNYVVLKKENQKIIPVTRKEAVKGLTDDLSQINSRLESLEQSGGGGDENSVKYVSQQLSAAQKEQARSNIGAVGKNSHEISINDLNTDLADKMDHVQRWYSVNRSQISNPNEGDVTVETTEEEINVTLPTGNESVTIFVPTGKIRFTWGLNDGSRMKSGYSFDYFDNPITTEDPDMPVLNIGVLTIISDFNIHTLPEGVTEIRLKREYGNSYAYPDFTIYLVSTNPYQYIGGKWVKLPFDISEELQNALATKQDLLVSGNNIKTINGVPILGSGDITIGSGGTFTQVQADWNQDDETAVDFIKNKPTINDNYEYLSYLDNEKEDKSNKVTSISNNSTDEEYPSAKLLYDQLALKQDKIDANHKLPANLVEGLDISGKEDKSNKVTSISASSTDTQYPSAKCVYDIVGDIETLLAAL